MSLFTPENQSCINYRFVVNDANCHPWEPMPEAGSSLSDLVEFLKTCTNARDKLGSRWDYRRLSFGGTHDDHIVSYGLRSQFWIPIIPRQEDFVWGEEVTPPVTCCGKRVQCQETYDVHSMCPDEGYMYHCQNCGRHTNSVHGTAARSKRAARVRWVTWFGEAK